MSRQAVMKSNKKPAKLRVLCLSLIAAAVVCMVIAFLGFTQTNSSEHFPIVDSSEGTEDFDRQATYEYLAKSLVDMYTTTDKQVQRDYINKLYMDKATFDDNLVIVHTVDGVEY